MPMGMSALSISAAETTDDLVGFLLARLDPGARANVKVAWSGGNRTRAAWLELPDSQWVELSRLLEIWLAKGGVDVGPIELAAYGHSDAAARSLSTLALSHPRVEIRLGLGRSSEKENSLRWAGFGADLASAEVAGLPGGEVADSASPLGARLTGPGSDREAAPEPPASAFSPFESLGPLPPIAPRQAPTRSAYGLLRCPETVSAGVELELLVGLSQNPEPGVAGGKFEVPDRSFQLVIQVVAQGFTPRPGESFRRALEVTPSEPYPTFALHLRPDRPTGAESLREIHASYTVDGQPVGFAVRYVTVVDHATPSSAAAEAPATGVNFPVPTAERAADLTVVIRRQLGAPSTLLWTFESRHPLSLPDRALETSIGSAPQDYTARLMNQVNQNQDAPFELLVGHGRLIGQLMPEKFWQLLGEATKLSPWPTVLILSEDPFVPWELAIPEEPIAEAHPPAVPARPAEDQATAVPSPFLGARAVVGRWVQPMQNQKRPPLPPPAQVRVEAAAVVSGIYTQAPRLVEAEAEAAEILADLARVLGAGAAKVEATRGEVLKCLGGNPAAHLLHFSLHGFLDRTGLEDGLLLVDSKFLLPDQVRGVNLSGRPFVFLNACQVGQGNELLGTYAGMAAAFLFAGASAVIAPLWSIDDKVAHSIAHSFYRETLYGREPVSAAELLRRERAKFVSNEQSATFVAYQFFGHPEMTLTLGRAAAQPPAGP